MLTPITIGNITIGNGRTFIIAELGYNFNTMDEAMAAIDAAGKSGADAVKFQTFRAETITSRKTFFPSEAGSANQFEEFKRYEMSFELHRILFDRTLANGMIPFSTPSFYDDVELLEQLDVQLYKVGSDDLTNLPFLDYVARKGKPMIISTGMAYLDEVDEAVSTIHNAGNTDLIVLHCTSNYPFTDYAHANIRAMATIGNALHVYVGYSDHTQEDFTSLAAVTLGACAIEKHYTLSREIDAPDCYFSYEPDDIQRLVETIRKTESALGSGIKNPAPSEMDMRQETRKSIHARRMLKAGEVITEADIIIKRPGTGIPPKFRDFVIGRALLVDLEEDDPVRWETV